MTFNKGDNVQLKEAIQGRYFKGKITKMDKHSVTVTLTNGMYAVFDEKRLEITEKQKETEVNG